ncbi:MAG: fasciclin domain-containing protein [Pseudomonadota bacterium]
MKRMMVAGFAGGAAMMIGGALGAVSIQTSADLAHNAIVDSNGGVMNPMIAGQAMLANRSLLENIAASPEHTTLAAGLRDAGIADALKGNGQFTLFAPTNAALSTLPARALGENHAELARVMGYLVVPGKYDSKALLKAIGEGGGQAKLRTVEGGVLVARMNGPTNIILMDEKGATADIAIYDVYDKNGVMHVIDHMLQPGMASRQLASR